MVEGGNTPPKIIRLIDLYDKHPQAVITRLLEYGLYFERAGEPGNEWSLIDAVLSTDPPWGPVSRAINGDKWVWYLPGFDQLQSLVESSALAMYQRAQKKPTGFKRARRPWDEKTKKLAAKVMPTKAFDDFFASRFTSDEEKE